MRDFPLNLAGDFQGWVTPVPSTRHRDVAMVSKHTAVSRGSRRPVRPKYVAPPVKHWKAEAMADTPKAPAHQDANPAITLLRGLVSHFEELGHRDMPQVLKAREYLTSLDPPAKPAGVTLPHNK
jgi:hypothetical protein